MSGTTGGIETGFRLVKSARPARDERWALACSRRLWQTVAGQIAPRLHRGLSEGRAMTRADPAAPGTGVADREPLDGVCLGGTHRVFLATALAGFA